MTSITAIVMVVAGFAQPGARVEDRRSFGRRHSLVETEARRLDLRLTGEPALTLGGDFGTTSITVTPDTPPTDVANVTVSWTGLANPNATTDWIGQVCVGQGIDDYIEFAPISESHGWEGGSGTIEFMLFRAANCPYEFRLFRGKQPLWPKGVVVAISNTVRWSGDDVDAPFHLHVAYGGEAAQSDMVVSWTTNGTNPTGGPGSAHVLQVGRAPGVYDVANFSAQETVTYAAADLCNAPANSTSIDYWQWPGLFHHATVTGLAPGTRYFARPLNGKAAGSETTFVTGKAVGPDVPVRFAAYGDMSVTGYLPTGQCVECGAVGTSVRVTNRLDDANDLDFVLHFGDLGYAKGAVFLWAAWMAFITPYASRLPYMVSIGNHEYDYHYPSDRDPSGSSQGVRNDMPAWFDGNVDSLGECGVGTAARFRSPTSRGGNGIFWYTFAVGSVTVIQLSSEHRCSPGTPQGDFVARELARVDRSVTPWVVVTHHRPVYHFCEENATVNEGFRSEREAVLLKYGVDLVMTGHSHNYARTCQLSNYTCTPGAPMYVSNGAAGAWATLCEIKPQYARQSESFTNTLNGVSYITAVNRTHLNVQFVLNVNNSVFDDVWIIKRSQLHS